MDALSLLVITGAVAVTAVVIYLIFVNGIASKSYEEALADQRRAQVEVKEKNSAPKKAWKPKKHRHDRKKKEKMVSGGEGFDNCRLYVDNETGAACSQEAGDTITIEESADDTSAHASPTPSPTPTPSPPVPVSHEAPPAATRVNGHAKKTATFAAAPAVDTTTTATTTAVKSETITSADIVDAVAPPSDQTFNTTHNAKLGAPPKINGVSSPPSEEEGVNTAVAVARKRRMADKRRAHTNSAVNHTNNDVSAKRVSAVIESAVLSPADIQGLIDLLLNKQSSSEWIATGGKPDPLTILKKQVEELEQRLLNEEKSVTSTEERLHQLRNQLNQELQRGTQLRRQLDEAGEKHSAELARQLQHLKQQHEKEVGVVKQQLATAQQLCSNEAALKQQLSRLTADHERLKCELAAAGSERDQLRSSAAERDQLLQQQLLRVQTASETGERERLALRAELQQLRSVHGGVERENGTLRQQLTSLQEQHRHTSATLADAERERLQHTADVSRLLNELQETRLELGQAREESAAQKQQNGLQRQLQSDHQQLEQLTKQLSEQKMELSEQKNQLSEQKKQLQLVVGAERQMLTQSLLESFPAVSAVNQDSSTWVVDISSRLQQTLESRVSEAVNQQSEKTADHNFSPNTDDAQEAHEANQETNIAVSDLQQANDGLVKQVAHYQGVLSQTESILKQLEVSVEHETKNWRSLLAEKQQEVDQLTAALKESSCRKSADVST